MLLTQILLRAMLVFTTPRSSSLVSSFTATSWSNRAAAAACRGASHRRQISSTSPCSLLFQRTKSLHMIYSSQRILPLQRPPDPSSFTNITTANNNKIASADDCGGKEEEEQNYIQTQATLLQNWFHNKSSILVITGAGISTDSGIPDYRGANGSYFNGHKPIIHHEYMSYESIRKRYWARSLIGYSPFKNAKPNLGHLALATLEELNLIGVDLTSLSSSSAAGGGGDSNINELLQDSCYGPSIDNNNNNINNRNQRLSIITQNVDILHSRAGSKHVLHLHGRGDIVKCMNCGVTRDRQDYHDLLLDVNRDWMEGAMRKDTTVVPREERGGGRGALSKEKKEKEEVVPLRPDGDADWYQESYDGMKLPPCPECGTTTEHHRRSSHKHQDGKKKNGQAKQQAIDDNIDNSFYKTDVVFFGDSVPKHRFDIAYTAIDAADGVLCIGTSLAVHSAYRLVKRAIDNGTDVAILNVGETRIESEGLDKQEQQGGSNNSGGRRGLVTKIESPIGETLAELVRRYNSS